MAKPVGFIGGGQMAVAMATGAVQAGVVQPNQLVFAQPSTGRQQFLREQFPDSQVVADAQTLLPLCDQVVLSVKPHILQQIAPTIAAGVQSQHLLISVAAGISLEQLQRWLGTGRVIRVMPNTPCRVLAGVSAIAASEDAQESDLQWVETLMRAVGLVERVSDHQISAVTGVAGSSPAYGYLMIEALSDGAVAMGLPRQQATRMAAQAMLGAAKMVLDTGLHPGELKDQVTSPGGTTIAALEVLEQHAVRGALMSAVRRCAERSVEMGREQDD